MPEHPPLPDTVNENAGNSGLDAGPAAAFGAASSPRATTHPGPVELRELPGEAEGTPAQPAPSDQAPSGTAGRNLLFGEIARGGMGAVLRGRDPALGRDLAVKVLLEAHRDNPELVGRFVEEAQIGGQLQHPGVVPVYELGQFQDDRPFFTMKLVKGQTLAKLLLQRTSPQEDLPHLLTVFEQVCQTIAYAHARGVIHRDLKPANVMVGAFGEVQVMDWGMAKVLHQERAADQPSPSPGEVTVIRTARSGSTAEASQPGTVLGTPAFMPPEQARGEVDKIDERADVFGLGAILCAILTGKPPYSGRDSSEVHGKAIRSELADALARLDGCGADAALVQLCKECLAAERDSRPRDAGAVAARMAAYQAGVRERLKQAELGRAAAQARAEEAKATTAAEARARRWAVGLAAAVLALVVIGSLGGLYFQRQADQRRAEVALQNEERRRDARAALEKAAGLRDRARWAEARLVLEQARDRLGEVLPEGLRQQLEKALSDLALVARLDDLRQMQAVMVNREFDTATARREYPVAFAEAGLGRVEEDEEAVAARIRDSAVKAQLVAALDNWAGITHKKEDLLFRWLLGVARRADPDPAWRDRFRDPAMRRDRAWLERLAREAKVEELSPQVVTALAGALQDTGADALPLLREAQRHHPDDFWLSYTLGYYCREAKKPEEAVGHYRAALAIQPQSVPARTNLGVALYDKGERKEAVKEYREALRLDPKYASAHNNLGGALAQKGEREEAIREFREVLRLDPKFAPVHYNLGISLYAKGEREEAINEYREAIRLDPLHAPAHTNLGRALHEQGRLEEAIKEYQEVLGLDPKSAPAHFNLGNGLRDKGQLDEATQEYRAAIELDPKFAEAYCNLGQVLRRQGKFAESLGSLRKGHELGSQRAVWPYPSAKWVRDSERLVSLESRLPEILEGKDQPADNTQRLALAQMCLEQKKFYAASVRFYEEAFADDSKLTNNPGNGHRYNAACAAALAGCDQGKDADKLDEKERARLRQRTLEWLRADLALWAKQADSGDPKIRATVQQTMKHWQTDADLGGVRDKDALAKLPAEEQEAWRKLWDDVAAVLKRVSEPR
jgi:serine/threonine-protein kinase